MHDDVSDVMPAVVPNLPTGHGTHSKAPVTLLYLPAGHAVQATALARLYRPAGHAVALLLACEGQWLPGGQSRQGTLPLPPLGRYFPAGHTIWTGGLPDTTGPS